MNPVVKVYCHGRPVLAVPLPFGYALCPCGKRLRLAS